MSRKRPAESGMSNRFARIPIDILTNEYLTGSDLRVFGVLAASARQTNIATIGQRLLATMCKMDRRSVRRSLSQLAKHGYISTSIFTMNRRSVYQINHPIFAPGFVDQLGAPQHPVLGAPVRPRIDIEKGNKEKLLSFPRSSKVAT